ncbi:MAG: hypothetical protein IJU57_03445 [Clostridia bacterium]|nr:hypothetical protein [Clostridia bacterium]
MDKKKRTRPPVYLTVMWSVIGLAVLASFFVMVFFSVKAIAGSRENTGNADSRKYTVPEILPRDNYPGDAVYIDPDTADLTSLIDVHSSYSAEIICANLSEGELNYDIFSLSRRGKALKASSPTKTVEFDGSLLSVKTELYSYTVPGTEKDFYLELGAASLEDVLSLSAGEDAATELSLNEKIIIVNAFDRDRGINHYYEISLETGLVTYEIHYLNGVVYKLTRIQNVNVFEN